MGEIGEGFSVVAVEIGKLAEQSKRASPKISSMLVQMMNNSENAVEVINSGIERAQASKALTTQAAVTFQTIFRELGAVLAEINKEQSVTFFKV